MNEDSLIRTFDSVYASAQAAHKAGRYNIAKRDYYRAAELMTELAKISGERQKAARVDRAKRLIAIADGLPRSEKRSMAPGSSDGDDAERGAQFETADIPTDTFDDVIGLDEAKEAIRIKMIYPMDHGELYAALGKKAGGGVLLYGPPGTGKTMLARAAANEAKAAFFSVKCSDIVSKWVGESEKNIAALFEAARKRDRAVIFFDELDSLFYKRGGDVHNDRRVNELLQQIDGFSGAKAGLTVLGATNNPEAVDDAAMRSGRFSQKIYIPLPDASARKKMIAVRLAKTRVDGEIDIDYIVSRTDGFSGADVAELIDRATDEPLRRSLSSGKVDGLTMLDVRSALEKVKPSVSAAAVEKFLRFGGN